MEELIQLAGRKLKPSEFAKLFFDFACYSYQTKAIDCNDRFVLLNFGRQSGKSTIAALRAVWEALWNDNQNIVVLAPKQQQASRLFKRIKAELMRSHNKFPELNLYKEIERETQRIIEFKNGSSIECLTIGVDGSNIRGITAHMIIIDEVALIENESVWSAIKPMIIATKGKMWLISTPKGVNNYFYKCANEKELGFTCFHATTFDNPNADLTQVNHDREWMPISMWEQEYMANFIDESDAFFDTRLVNSFFDNEYDERKAPLPGATYFLGIDPASQGQDQTVYAVLEKFQQYCKIVKYVEVSKETIPQLAHRALMLYEIWKFQKCFVDATGVGTGLAELMAEYNIPTEPIWQTNQMKIDLYTNLKTHMQNGLGSIRHDKARKQLLDMKYGYTLQKQLKIYSGQSTKSGHIGGDDYPVAIGLAALALKRPSASILFAKARGTFQQ